jgi:hypothetical protein
MAGTTGLEPATSAVTGQRSNQLSYVPKQPLQFNRRENADNHLAANRRSATTDLESLAAVLTRRERKWSVPHLSWIL